MEGSSMRTSPRMLLDQPVELQIGSEKIWIEDPSNNLSVGGMFVHRKDLPVGASVHVRIEGRHPFEADGQIRNCDTKASGVGIGFNSGLSGNREALYELIEDLTLRGLPAA
jgi:hypothetical protein